MDKNKKSNVIPFINTKSKRDKASNSISITSKQSEIGHHRLQAYEQLLKGK